MVNTRLSVEELHKNVTLGLHTNLNTREEQIGKFYEDDGVHLRPEGTKIFASNLKFYICKGLGVQQVANTARNRSRSPPWGRQKYNQNNRRRVNRR